MNARQRTEKLMLANEPIYFVVHRRLNIENKNKNMCDEAEKRA